MAEDVWRYGEGIEVAVGQELVGRAIEQPDEGDIAALQVKSPEVGPAEAAEGEFFTAFDENGIEGLSWIGERDGGKRASDIAAPEQGIQIGEGGSGITCPGGTFGADEVKLIGGQSGEGPDDMGIAAVEIGQTAAINLVEQRTSKILGAVRAV